MSFSVPRLNKVPYHSVSNLFIFFIIMWEGSSLCNLIDRVCCCCCCCRFILLRMYWGLHVIVYSQVATLFYGSGVVVYGVWFIWGGLGDALSSAASLGWLASPFP
jgi:hypothetical protein